jgi:hypothetical protein
MRIVQSFDQQDFAILLGQHTGGHFGIAEEDEAAIETLAAHAPEDEFIDQRVPAARTIVHFQGFGHAPYCSA